MKGKGDDIMKLIDKIMGLTYFTGVIIIGSIAGIAVYILTLAVIMYLVIRGKTTFMEEFKVDNMKRNSKMVHQR